MISAPGSGTYTVNNVILSHNVYSFSSARPITITPNSSVVMNVYASISKGIWNPSQDFADLFMVSASSEDHEISLMALLRDRM